MEIKYRDQVAYWKIQNPSSRNAISRDLLSRLHNSVSELSTKPLKDLPRVLVLEGIPGIAFSAGADLKERKTMSKEEVWEFLDQFRETLNLMEHLPFPTIAAISGVALGGGLEIALAMDFRIVREDVKLGLPESKLGIIPGAGGTQRLSRLISPTKAKEWIFSGKIYSAREALDAGVANYCYTIQDFEDKVHAFASQFLDSAPISLRAAKASIQSGVACEMEKALDIERFHYKTTIDTIDREEALLAFQEKRKPIFRGE